MITPTHDYLRARGAADEHGMSVCGTFKDGKPLYFLASPDATDDRIRELAFEAQNGRPMTEDELRLLNLVKSRRPESLEASLEDLP